MSNHVKSKIENKIKALLDEKGSSEATLRETLKLVLGALNSETGTIHYLNREKQTLHLVSQIGLPPFLLETVRLIPVGKGIAGETVASGRPVTICNLQTDKSGVARPGAKQTGIGGALCVPLRNGDSIVGAIGIGTMRQHEYTPEETRTLEEAGRLIGAAVQAPGPGIE
jgi:L-methionine (R)-S-oxide reductase